MLSTEPTTENNNTTPKTKASWLSITAIVIGVASIALSAYNLFSATNTQSQALYLQNEVSKVTAMSQKQSHHLQALQEQLSSLQTSTPLQTQKIIAELGYFVTVANTQLTALHDPESALRTLMLAQNTISSSNDARFMAMNQALTADMKTLHTAPVVPTAQLYSDIFTLIQKIQTLSSLPSAPDISLQKTVTDITTAHSDKPWYLAWIDNLKQLKNVIIIRHVDASRAPLLAPNVEAYLKQNISLQLMMAQWALLHHNQKVYQIALQSAQEWITKYFVLSQEKNAVLAQLSQLMQAKIDPVLPTIDRTSDALGILTQMSLVKQPAAQPSNIVLPQVQTHTSAPASTPSVTPPLVKPEKPVVNNPTSVET